MRAALGGKASRAPMPARQRRPVRRAAGREPRSLPRCPVTGISARYDASVLLGSETCSALLHRRLREPVRNTSFGGIALVVAAALTPAVLGQGAVRDTCCATYPVLING
jgi:hypothetical protein